MSAPNDGGPAFPAYEYHVGQMLAVGGMSLRDYFAAKALNAALVNATLPGIESGDPDAMAALNALCSVVYRIADAMLAARKSGEQA
jgi:hypothetical protein